MYKVNMVTASKILVQIIENYIYSKLMSFRIKSLINWWQLWLSIQVYSGILSIHHYFIIKQSL